MNRRVQRGRRRQRPADRPGSPRSHPAASRRSGGADHGWADRGPTAHPSTGPRGPLRRHQRAGSAPTPVPFHGHRGRARGLASPPRQATATLVFSFADAMTISSVAHSCPPSNEQPAFEQTLVSSRSLCHETRDIARGSRPRRISLLPPGAVARRSRDSDSDGGRQRPPCALLDHSGAQPARNVTVDTQGATRGCDFTPLCWRLG
jgi:hypothetical protein